MVPVPAAWSSWRPGAFPGPSSDQWRAWIPRGKGKGKGKSKGIHGMTDPDQQWTEWNDWSYAAQTPDESTRPSVLAGVQFGGWIGMVGDTGNVEPEAEWEQPRKPIKKPKFTKMPQMDEVIHNAMTYKRMAEAFQDADDLHGSEEDAVPTDVPVQQLHNSRNVSKRSERKSRENKTLKLTEAFDNECTN